MEQELRDWITSMSMQLQMMTAKKKKFARGREFFLPFLKRRKEKGLEKFIWLSRFIDGDIVFLDCYLEIVS
jgi:hypothetical protein